MSSEPGHGSGSGNDVTSPAHPKPDTADIPSGRTPDGELVPADATRPTTPEPTESTKPESAKPTTTEPATRLSATRTAWTWATVVVAILILVILLIFILQNLQSVTVAFLGLRGTLPLGIAMLLSAAVGGLLVALIGSARILQLRRTARRRKH